MFHRLDMEYKEQLTKECLSSLHVKTIHMMNLVFYMQRKNLRVI